jgi:hypothetical protein
LEVQRHDAFAISALGRAFSVHHIMEMAMVREYAGASAYIGRQEVREVGWDMAQAL